MVERSFGKVHDDDHPLFGPSGRNVHPPDSRRRAVRRHHNRHRRGRISVAISLLAILVVILASWSLVRGVAKRFAVADYRGGGHGLATVQVRPGDTAADIAAAMTKAGVVKSARAFVNAAKASGRSDQIQPGIYRIPLQSSGKAAVAAVLDPANRLESRLTVPEGQTEKQILEELVKPTGLSLGQLTEAAAKLDNLGLPDGYSAKSAEGFLFPATYEFNPNTSAELVLQSFTTKFGGETAKLNFAAGARALNITPYQALIVASLVESEAKFPEDRPKVARVIYNRLAHKMPIGIDAANRYGVALQGRDPNSVTFEENSPYNVRKRTGLPPTPISNPGEASLRAAITPDAGNWLFYVVDDPNGHHFFTSDAAQFQAAVQRCRASGWGC